VPAGQQFPSAQPPVRSAAAARRSSPGARPGLSHRRCILQCPCGQGAWWRFSRRGAGVRPSD